VGGWGACLKVAHPHILAWGWRGGVSELGNVLVVPSMNGWVTLDVWLGHTCVVAPLGSCFFWAIYMYGGVYVLNTCAGVTEHA